MGLSGWCRITTRAFSSTSIHPPTSLFILFLHYQPVSIIDMPDMADATEKEIITQACEMLRLEYADMFKPSSNCRLPHVNIGE